MGWTDEAGVVVGLEDPAALKAAVRRRFRAREWAAVAAKRADVRGAEGGVDEELTGGLRRRLAKRGSERKAGALRCILAGGTWPRARLVVTGLVGSARCPRCGEEDETALRRWWKCPALGPARHQAQVEDLAPGAARGFQRRVAPALVPKEQLAEALRRIRGQRSDVIREGRF